MVSRQEAEKLGFKIDFTSAEQTGKYRFSYDSGQSWRTMQLYNDPEIILGHELGQFYVKRVLNPKLKEGESLCHICANHGQVGIVRYAGIVEGTETQTVAAWDESGEYAPEDRTFWCRYAQWKCQRCGHLADSEYA